MFVGACLFLFPSSSRGVVPAAYSSFPDANSAFSRPVSAEALKKQFLERTVLRPPPLPMDAAALRSAIVDGLNIGFMLKGLDSRELQVKEAGDSRRAGYLRRRLLFKDPFIGELEAWLLLPSTGAAGGLPAVLGLPGHGDTASDFENTRLGADLARAGYIVLIPVFRVYSLDKEERDLSLRFLRGGFTLMGLRVYETMLALKYLRALKEADPSKIGVFGHSGGSVVANLLVRLTGGIAAQAGDYRIDYLAAADGTENSEHLPAIFPLSGTINNLATLPFPHLTVQYGFTDAVSRRQVLDFFSAALLHSGAMPPDKELPAEDHFVKARIEAGAGEKAAALASLDKALGADPGPEELPRIAALYAELGETGKAEEVLQGAAKRTDAPAPLIDLAGLAAGAGNKELALERLSRAEGMALQAEDKQRIALIYQELREYGRALELLRGLAAENPGNAVFLAALGLCEYLGGDRQAAEKHLLSAIEKAPARLSAYLTLGGIYSAGGRDEAASALYDRALALKEPEGGGALRDLIARQRKALPPSSARKTNR